MNKLFKLFSLLALTATVQISSAQKAVVTKDAFTGEQLVSWSDGWSTYTIKNKIITLSIPFTYGGQRTDVIPAGSEVMIKLENGDVVKLTTKEDAKPTTRVYASQYSAGINSTYLYIFEIDKATLDKLSKIKSELQRFPNLPTGTVDLTGKTGKKLGKSMQKGAMKIIPLT